MLALAYSILYPGASLLLLGALEEITETITIKTTKRGKISSPKEHNALNHYSHFTPPNKCEEQAISWKQVCAGSRSQSLLTTGPQYSMLLWSHKTDPKLCFTCTDNPSHYRSPQPTAWIAFFFFFSSNIPIRSLSLRWRIRDNWYPQKLEGKTLILNSA